MNTRKAMSGFFSLVHGCGIAFLVWTIGYIIIPWFAGIDPAKAPPDVLGMMMHIMLAIGFMYLVLLFVQVWSNCRGYERREVAPQIVFWSVAFMGTWFFAPILPFQIIIIILICSIGMGKYLSVTI
jgi:hypothetical protein